MTATQAQFRERLAETADPGPWRGVYFDGPQPDQDPEGEEIPYAELGIRDFSAPSRRNAGGGGCISPKLRLCIN